VTITGTSGSQIATTPLTIAIYPQSFTLYDNESVTLGQGTSSASIVSINLFSAVESLKTSNL
jgi:hypothetical protein